MELNKIKGFRLLERSDASWATVRDGKVVDKLTDTTVFEMDGVNDTEGRPARCQVHQVTVCGDSTATLVVFDAFIDARYTIDLGDSGDVVKELNRFRDVYRELQGKFLENASNADRQARRPSVTCGGWTAESLTNEEINSRNSAEFGEL